MSSADDAHKGDHANKVVGNGKVSIGSEQGRGREKRARKRKEELSSDSESGGGGENKHRSKEAVRKDKTKTRRKKGNSSSDEEDSSDDERKRKKRRSGRRLGKRENNDQSSSSSDDDGDSSEDEDHRKGKKQKNRRRRRKSDTSDSSSSDSSEDDHRRRKRRHLTSDGLRKKGHVESETLDSEDDKRRRKQRDKDRKKRRQSSDRKKSKSLSEAERKRAKKEKKKKLKEKLGTGAVTDRYGKYGIIREVDMWNKRPEFGAWLHEVKHVNIETLPNREERELFKDFMEDYNTATLPSKKYYNLELHHRNKVAKMHARGQQLVQAEKVVFDDEAEKRNELQRQRDQKKEADYEAYKASMAAGLAQDMREQEHLRNEMQYQYRLGNMEAVDTIKRRLAPEDPSTVPIP